MRNNNHRPRRHFRSRNDGRGFQRNGSSGVDFIRNNVSPDSNSRRIFRGNQNASTLLEKYLNLGKKQKKMSSHKSKVEKNQKKTFSQKSKVEKNQKKTISQKSKVDKNQKKMFFPNFLRKEKKKTLDP